MLVCDNKELKKLLKQNKTFKMNFEKILNAFEKKIWTKQTCFFFKSLLEELFKSYSIPVRVHTQPNAMGDGKFEIEFLDELKEIDNEII